MLTLLSQHTSDHNSGRAFHRLIERFPAWDDVLQAGEVIAVEPALYDPVLRCGMPFGYG